MFLELTGFDCGGEVVLTVIKFVMILLDVVFFIVPIVLILMLSFDFAKNVFANREDDMKKNVGIAIKRLLMCVCLFLVSPVIQFSISLLGDLGLDYADCVEIARNDDLSQYKVDLIPETPYNPPSVDLEGGSGMEAVDNGSDYEESIGSNDSSDSSNTSSVQNIFIGDSRFVGMKAAVEDSDAIWYAEVGQGYSWLSLSISSKLDTTVESGEKYNIIINLGVNDLNSYENYIKFYKQLSENEKYANCNIIIVSVNPIDDNSARKSGYNVRNTNVSSFNTSIKNGISELSSSKIKYCDTYSELMKDGYETSDGVHYKNATYKKIYEEIKKCL